MSEQSDSLRQQRLARGLTQAQAAELMGVTATCWRYWETGRRGMSESHRRLWEVIRMSSERANNET